MLHAVLMVGGSGTRLWPRSRRARPKQLMKIGGDENLMRGCLLRAIAAAGAANVLVVTTAEFEDLCREQMPELPAENIVAEPCGRDTAAAVGLGAVLVRARDPDGVMAVLPADHLIEPAGDFVDAMCAAAAIADERRCIVTTGIVPTGPATGYGYIQRGEPVDAPGGAKAYRALRFKEKPDEATAQAYLDGGDHYWNSGIFVWRADVILDAFAAHAPDHAKLLDEIAAAAGTGGQRAAIASAYERFERISVDYAIMEHATDVVVVEAAFTWDDVGSWTAVGRHLPADEAGNAVDGELIAVDTTGCVVLGGRGRTIAAVGLEDMVIVDDGDVIFVCPKDRDQDVRRIVERLRADGREDLL